jgi:hypothetical protein
MKLTAFSALVLSMLSLTSLGAFTGCAADATPGEDEDPPTEALQDELSSIARPLVDSYVWMNGESAFTDFETLTLKANGTYSAKVESGLVNPAVRCIRFPCTLPETGKWNAFRSAGKLRVLVRPSGNKPWRYYAAVRTPTTLDLTRFGETTTLTSKASLPTCAATLCMVGTQCVEGPTGAQCVPFTPPKCEVMDCGPGSVCIDGPNGGECKSSTTPVAACRKTGCSGQICADQDMVSTCEFRPEYACYQAATCERQANGNCGFTQTPSLAACLASK